jgi:hypothetical protein
VADPDIPELRMIGSPPNQKWQWKFPSEPDQWRDMMGTITEEMKRDKDRQVTALPDWLGGAIIHKGPSIFSALGEIEAATLGIGGEKGILSLFGEDHPKAVVDFDILAKTTKLLPDDFLATHAKEYIMAVAELWREVTGYVPAKGNQAAQYDNQQTYKGAIDGNSELFKIAGDLAEEMNWRGVADNRGYDIDWDDSQAVADFLYFAHDDFARGVKYDDEAATSTGQNFASNTPLGAVGADYYNDADLMETGGAVTKPGTDRKVIAEVGKGPGAKRLANEWASRTPNGKAEEIDGQWVVTVPPGQGGFTSIDAGDDFIRDSGLDPTKWEMASTAEGEFVIREIKPEAATQGHDTVKESRAALVKTGADPTQYEYRERDGKIYPVYVGKAAPAVPGTWDSEVEAEEALRRTARIDRDTKDNYETAYSQGKWIIREKEPELRYSTPTTYDAETGDPTPGIPGEMFEPTITEDPTGRKFGLTAGGDIQDFGYGMAGDITQESLAGYQVPYRSLEMIVAKAIEQGNWELARGVQAFMDRPTERDLLDYAAQYAEAPADLAVLSSIARGEQMVQPAVPLPEGMGTAMGQATRIGAPGEEYTSAYARFKEAMNEGFDPSLKENEEVLRQLFDPKMDPVYQATQELAAKYETEIGTLRNDIAEANKTASERIENTQTSTMNLMSGLFKDTIGSFKDLLKETTNISASEIARLQSEIDWRRTNPDQFTISSPSGRTLFDPLGGEGEEDPLDPLGGEGEEDPLDPLGGEGEEDPLDPLGGEGKKDPLDPLGGEGEEDPLDPLGGEGEEDPLDPLGGEGKKPFTKAEQAAIQSEIYLPSQLVENVPAREELPLGEPLGILSPATLQQEYTSLLGPRGEGNIPARENLEAYRGTDTYSAPTRLAEGGVVQGPTMALLGEEEPEFIVPFSKVDEFKRGQLPLGKPRQTQMSGTVAKFEDSIPRFANGGMVTGPASRNMRFGGVTASELRQYGDTGAYVRPETYTELGLGAEGQYGADGISRAPSIAATDFESLLNRYDGEGNIPEYELRQRLGASEFAGTNPAKHPIGIQQLMAGRPLARPRSLMTAANMPKPSGQALRNMLPSEMEYYQKMGRMAGIPQADLEREMRSVMPGGTRRTPLRMGARRVRQA